MIDQAPAQATALTFRIDADVVDEIRVGFRPGNHVAEDAAGRFDDDRMVRGDIGLIVGDHRCRLTPDPRHIFGVGGNCDRAHPCGIVCGCCADMRRVGRHCHAFPKVRAYISRIIGRHWYLGKSQVLCGNALGFPCILRSGSLTDRHENPPARVRRPRTCAGLEDRGVAAGRQGCGARRAMPASRARPNASRSTLPIMSR